MLKSLLSVLVSWNTQNCIPSAYLLGYTKPRCCAMSVSDSSAYEFDWKQSTSTKLDEKLGIDKFELVAKFQNISSFLSSIVNKLSRRSQPAQLIAANARRRTIALACGV